MVERKHQEIESPEKKNKQKTKQSKINKQIKRLLNLP